MFRAAKSFLFKNKTPGQTIAKNTVWLFVSFIGSRLLRVVILVWAARVLGSSGWGAFSYALSFAAFFTVFTDFGMSAVITRESSKNIASQERYFATGLLIKSIMLAAAAVVIAVLFPLLTPHDTIVSLLPLVVLLVIFDSMRDFAATLSRAWEKMEVEAGIQLFTNAAIVVVGAAALILSPTPKSFTVAYTIAVAAGMLVALYPFRRYLLHLRRMCSWALVKPILAASWPFGMVALMGAVLLNTDVVMIGWYKTTEAVGYYAAGQRVAQLIYAVPALIAAAFFPQMARANSDGTGRSSLLNKALKLQVLLAVPATIAGFFGARAIVTLLYGAAYEGSVGSFAVMSITYLPVFISAVSSNALFAAGHERHLLRYVVAGITGNVLLNFLFIPRFGIEGAAWSTVINQAAITAYLLFMLRRHISYSLDPGMWKIAVAGGTALLLAIYGMRTASYSLLPLIAAAASYLLVLVVLKEELLMQVLRFFRPRETSAR